MKPKYNYNFHGGSHSNTEKGLRKAMPQLKGVA